MKSSWEWQVRPLRAGLNVDSSWLLPLPPGVWQVTGAFVRFVSLKEKLSGGGWSRRRPPISPAWPPSTSGSPLLLIDVGVGAGAQLWGWSVIPPKLRVGLSWVAEVRGQNPNPHLSNPNGLSIFTGLRNSRKSTGAGTEGR